MTFLTAETTHQNPLKPAPGTNTASFTGIRPFSAADASTNIVIKLLAEGKLRQIDDASLPPFLVEFRVSEEY